MQTLDEIGILYGTDKSSAGHGYLETYEHFIRQYRDFEFTLIEIGGLNGASLKMWAEYFPKASIVCLDINPEVKRFEGGRIRVEIGDAGKPEFLFSVADSCSNIMVIIDDGSHRWDHMRIAFTTLYPLLAPGGTFIVEDLHTSFDVRYAGFDDVPFSEALLGLSRVLLSRGEARRGLTTTLSPRLRDSLNATESISFLNRSCIIRKKLRGRKDTAAA